MTTDLTIRSAIGTYERKTQAIASVTLAPGDGSPLVLFVGKREYKARREAGWNKALANAIAADKTAEVTAVARGEFLDLVAIEGGEPGNNVSLRGEGLVTPASLSGGRVEFVAEEVEYDGAGVRRMWILGVYKSAPEANACIRTKVMQAFTEQTTKQRNSTQHVRPPHKFRTVGGETGCAECGKPADFENHIKDKDAKAA